MFTEPLTNFKKLAGVEGELEIHNRAQYHKASMLAGKDFLRNYSNLILEVHNCLNADNLVKCRENFGQLLTIVKTIFCGKQNICVHGH